MHNKVQKRQAIKSKRSLSITLLITVCVVLSGIAFAAEKPPTGGRILEEIRKNQPNAPVQEKQLEIKTDIPTKTSPEALSQLKIMVKAWRITGNTIFSEEKLKSLISCFIGKEASMSDLLGAARKIEKYYNESGYLLASAYLPAQSIMDGIITITVIEGRIGRIEITKDQSVRYSDSTLNRALSGSIKKDSVVNESTLERGLLLTSDLPGLDVKSTLKPGAEVGTTDLVVEVKESAPLSAILTLDNYGNRYTGRYRLGPIIAINNLSGFGESTSISGTFAAGLQYGRAAITVPAGLWGTRIGSSYSALTYYMRDDFKDLGANGDAYVTSAYIFQTIVRSRNFNLYANLEYDFRQSEDRIDLFESKVKKDADVAILSLTGDMRDNLLGGGLTGLTITLFAGNLDIKNPEVKFEDEITLQTNGSYYKGLLNAWRQQSIIGDLSGYLAYTQQLASKNLDSSEDFILGGPYGVRSYPQGEAPADEAYLMTAELRYNLNRLLMQKAGFVELIGFIDYGKAHINKFPQNWDPSNTRYLSGSGLGVNWTLKNFFLKASYGWKLGHEKATSESDHGDRFWLQMMAWF